jgi:(p)ppGpp synthase/HD superfamily hydrolase
MSKLSDSSPAEECGIARVVSATNFAAMKHSAQRRKNKEKSPYINHPIEVMAILSDAGICDPDVLIGAVLHDTVEDTDCSYEEITALFGERVMNIVMDCSDDKALDKIERKRYQVFHSKMISDEGKLVKLADKLSNCRGLSTDPPASWSKEIVVGYAYWSYAVCLSLTGLNAQLDEQLKTCFREMGVPDMVSKEELEAQLESYYALLIGKD